MVKVMELAVCVLNADTFAILRGKMVISFPHALRGQSGQKRLRRTMDLGWLKRTS